MKQLENLNLKLTDGKIKSTELVEIINVFREEEGKNPKEHSDFMKKIKKEIETLKSLGLDNEGNFSPVEYIDKKGEKRPCYELTHDGMLEMLNSESVYCRAKTIEYINKLEEDVKQLKEETSDLNRIAQIEDNKQREYERKKTIYGWKNITNTLEDCSYKNIEDTVEDIIDFHTNVLKKKDRQYNYSEMDKKDYKQAVRDRLYKALDKIYRNTLDVTLRTITAELKENMVSDKLKTVNRSNAQIQSKLQKKLDEACPSLSWIDIDYHGFTVNCMFKYDSQFGVVKTDNYKNWINNFPMSRLPYKCDYETYLGIDFTKPIELFVNYVCLDKFDVENLNKSFIDLLFNRHFKVDDNIVTKVHSEKVGSCDTYEDGKIYFALRNVL